ncbi:MAG: YihY family inner membrane protein [Gammaproteobacteria bacterium]|nr:YihY family inner membrane protein [Gammaproteobacteria bacterium]
MRRRLVDFVRHVVRRFKADRCSSAAAALAYTSLLGIVPLFTVVFVLLSAVPLFRELARQGDQFLFANFVPAFGDTVRSYVVAFSAKARDLTLLGFGMLVVTVILLMSTIETTFNVIWRVRRQRPFAVRLVRYLAALALGPLLAGSGLVATSYLASLPLLARMDSVWQVETRLLWLYSRAATALAFVLFFKLLPNRFVAMRDALAGGLVATALFEIAKQGFAWYVLNVPTQQLVYGTFATLPVLLVWIYLCWVILLLGAEITHSLGALRLRRAGPGPSG